MKNLAPGIEEETSVSQKQIKKTFVSVLEQLILKIAPQWTEMTHSSSCEKTAKCRRDFTIVNFQVAAISEN